MLAAAEAWQPAVLFLDFDRTLCSTRGGANPLAGGTAYSVDESLHTAANKWPVHVLTRNRHTAEIARFLAARGLPVVAIHSTPSGESKAAYIAQTLEAMRSTTMATAGVATGLEEATPTALFVDDSANEVCDPRVQADARVFRFLFQR